MNGTDGARVSLLSAVPVQPARRIGKQVVFMAEGVPCPTSPSRSIDQTVSLLLGPRQNPPPPPGHVEESFARAVVLAALAGGNASKELRRLLPFSATHGFSGAGSQC